MATAAKFVLSIPIFWAYLLPLDVDVTGNITAKICEVRSEFNIFLHFGYHDNGSHFEFLQPPKAATHYGGYSYKVSRSLMVLNFCGIVAVILKMETGRNFSMSGINSGHHNLPTYEISLNNNNNKVLFKVDIN